MSHYVLVHGAWHGAWCWQKVIPLLERAGHTAEAIDLPGHGDDRTPPDRVTLDAYVERVGEALARHERPVILTGHSMGGLVITQAAERWPDKVERLVYICAYLLPDGSTLLGAAEKDQDSEILRHLEPDEKGGVFRLSVGSEGRLFYERCSPEEASRAVSRLVPQPAAVAQARLQTTPERFGRTPRVYIETLRDRVVSPGFQRSMYTELPCEQVISMDTDHSPFLSAPEELARHLAGIAAGS